MDHEHASESDNESGDNEHRQVDRGRLDDRRNDDEDDARKEDRLSAKAVREISDDWKSQNGSDGLRGIDNAQFHTGWMSEILAPLLKRLQPVHQRSCDLLLLDAGRPMREALATYHHTRQPTMTREESREAGSTSTDVIAGTSTCPSWGGPRPKRRRQSARLSCLLKSEVACLASTNKNMKTSKLGRT